jgi:hypothetical protein
MSAVVGRQLPVLPAPDAGTGGRARELPPHRFGTLTKIQEIKKRCTIAKNTVI